MRAMKMPTNGAQAIHQMKYVSVHASSHPPVSRYG